MYKTITKLSAEQRSSLISDFLTKLGERIGVKRRKNSLSQEDLAYCLDIDRSTLSKYESGDRDMQVSMLPLFSTYCKFPLHELFPIDESREILDSFAAAVSITVDRKKRKEYMRQKKAIKSEELKKMGLAKVLKGQVFDIDGMEVFEPVSQKQQQKSLRDSYKDAEMQTGYEPYSETEFSDYVSEQKREFVEPMILAGQFLRQIEDLPNKETLKGLIADYIVDELVINDITQGHPDEMSRRAYEYYRRLYFNCQDKGDSDV